MVPVILDRLSWHFTISRLELGCSNWCINVGTSNDVIGKLVTLCYDVIFGPFYTRNELTVGCSIIYMDSIHCYILFVENAKILNNKTYSSIVKTRIALVAYNDGVPKNRLGAPFI